MRPRRAASESGSGLDMTPLIDMTFQLIAFFMFVLNFSKDVADERVRLPIADQAVPVEGATEEPLFLNIDRDGNLLAVGNSWNVQTEQPAIKNYLVREARRAEQAMFLAGEKGKLWTTVIIRADISTPYSAIRELIAMCQEKPVGFYKFALRAMPQEEL